MDRSIEFHSVGAYFSFLRLGHAYSKIVLQKYQIINEVAICPHAPYKMYQVGFRAFKSPPI